MLIEYFSKKCLIGIDQIVRRITFLILLDQCLIMMSWQFKYTESIT